VFSFLCRAFAFFFTIRALFGFGFGFVVFDMFLEFLLKDLFDEVSSVDEEKGIEFVDGFAVGCVIGDVIEIVEEGVEASEEERANISRSR